MVDQTILTYLNRLGLEPEESQVYLALAEKNTLTAAQIAQETTIPKTTVYRRLENLKKLNLVEEIVDEYKRLFKPASPTVLDQLIRQKEEEIQTIKAALPKLVQTLIGQSGALDKETKVVFYRGGEGIKQMLWNTLRAKKEIVGYTYRIMSDITGRKFAWKWNQEFNFLHLSGRDLYSDEFLKSKKNPDNIEPGNWDNWPSRYISPKILDIQHQMDIYNDVVGIYNWHEGEVFGVEIYNEKVAKMQKQIFDIVWKLANKTTL